jgi:hypothetical protein
MRRVADAPVAGAGSKNFRAKQKTRNFALVALTHSTIVNPQIPQPHGNEKIRPKSQKDREENQQVDSEKEVRGREIDWREKTFREVEDRRQIG